MPIISLENHPSNIIVITGANPKEAFLEAKQLLEEDSSLHRAVWQAPKISPSTKKALRPNGQMVYVSSAQERTQEQ